MNEENVEQPNLMVNCIGEISEESKTLPRITIEVTEDFKRQIKIKLASEGMTITTLVNNLLTQWLENDKSRS